jgi:hypothetical protein
MWPLKHGLEIKFQQRPNCCSGELKVTAILDRPVIEKNLTHLGLEPRAGAKRAMLDTPPLEPNMPLTQYAVGRRTIPLPRRHCTQYIFLRVEMNKIFFRKRIHLADDFFCVVVHIVTMITPVYMGQSHAFYI